MARTPRIVNLKDTYQKWVKLLTYVQNSTESVFKCAFHDEAEAKHAQTQIHNACARDSWFRLKAFRRQNEVYIVKSDTIQEIIIIDR